MPYQKINDNKDLENNMLTARTKNSSLLCKVIVKWQNNVFMCVGGYLPEKWNRPTGPAATGLLLQL